MNNEEKDLECIYHEKNESCVSRIRLFRNLSAEAQKILVDGAVHSFHKKGSILVQEGDPIDSILIIRKGRIKTCHVDQDGEEHILDVLHDGQAIWHGMFLEDHVYHYSVVCITDVYLCEISRDVFMKVLSQQPETAMSLIVMLSTELDDAEEKALMLSTRDPEKRLAGFLLHRNRRCTGPCIRMKLDDIAASISLRPETVSRNLVSLEKRGFVKREGQGKIRVTDAMGLKGFYFSN